MNDFTKFNILMGSIMVIIIIIGVFVFGYINDQQDNSCKEIGFESYEFIMGMQYCEDSLGNLHYIDLECDFFMTNCKTREISVGDVRTVRGD